MKNFHHYFLNIKKSCLYLFICLSLLYNASAMAEQFNTKSFGVISYTDAGHGQPLVLIHAFPTDQRLWIPQQENLKAYFRVITLDLWGFGKSAATNGQAITMNDYAEEVNLLLRHLHIQKAIIGGESMGGYIALAFLNKHPEKIAGLILSDTQSIADTPEAKAKREATAKEVVLNGSTQLIHDFMPKALSSAASQQTRSTLHSILATQIPTGIASALRGMAVRDNLSDQLSQSELPILILSGDQDTLISPQQSHNMHALAKNSKLVTIHNAGHLANLEQPGEWNQAVINMFYQPENKPTKA